MLHFVAAFLMFAGSDGRFELTGKIQPQGRAAVALYGATTPFSESTLSDSAGRFKFKNLVPGPYTVAVFFPDRGEARQTVEIGQGTADAQNRVTLTLNFKDSDFVFADSMKHRHAVSAHELAIPERATREYQEAQKDLSRRDVPAATKHLERAVELAPQFATAWNNLGTIAYQTKNFMRAEECFREALEQQPDAYEPLVNLGGVLVTLHKLDDAWKYNVYAVLVRPNDALANSQLGMTYFELANFELSLKYLERARQIDPAHFSHPQLLLAEIHLRQGNKQAAAADLEEFLKYHPDWPQAAKMREAIAEFRR